jgi:hypothetical protein
MSAKNLTGFEEFDLEVGGERPEKKNEEFAEFDLEYGPSPSQKKSRSAPPEFSAYGQKLASSPVMRLIQAGATGLLSGASQVLGPQNLVRLATGQEVPDVGQMAAELTGFTPETGAEHLASAIGGGAGSVIGGGPIGAGGKLAKVAALGGAGGAASYGAEKAGAGSIGQFVAGSLPFLAAGAISPKLTASGVEKGFIKQAEFMGASPKEIAPLVASPLRKKLGESFVTKASTRQKILNDVQKGADKVINWAQNSTEAIGAVPQTLRKQVLRDLSGVLKESTTKAGIGAGNLAVGRVVSRNLSRLQDKKPSTIKAVAPPPPKKLGRIVRRDLSRLKDVKKRAEKAVAPPPPKKLTGTDLWDMYREINDSKAMRESRLGQQVKSIIREAIGEASPTAGEQFNFANRYYARAKSLKKGFKNAGGKLDRIEQFGLMASIIAGHPIVGAASFFGSEAARTAFTKAMASPRGHKIFQKMATAVDQGKNALALSAAKKLQEEVDKYMEEEEEG